MSAIHQLPVQRYSEVFELEKGRQAFVVVGDFQFTFTILVVDVDDCRHRFCSAELQLPHLEQWFSTTVTRAACGTQEPFAAPKNLRHCGTQKKPAALRQPAALRHLRHCGTRHCGTQPAAPKNPLCGPQQSFETSNVLCSRHRSAKNKNVSIDLLACINSMHER